MAATAAGSGQPMDAMRGQAMTAAARARKVVDDHLGTGAFIVGKGLLEFRVVLASVIREAVAEEREACAKIMCGDCRSGVPLTESGKHSPGQGSEWPCEALDVWRRYG